MIEPPCKGCSQRVIACHATCIKYIDYKQKLDAYNKEKAERRNIVFGNQQYIRKAVARMKG